MNKLDIVSGKRKTSIAKAVVLIGNGNITLNKMSHNLLNQIHKLQIEEPIRIAKEILGNFNFDINVKVVGGGRESQIEAARLAIAKAIFQKTKSEKLKQAYLNYDRHLLIADIRRKEAYKPGDSKARSKRQSSKR
jgi:small subunit ribosomal protein S9